jgi:hypothetical protein
LSFALHFQQTAVRDESKKNSCVPVFDPIPRSERRQDHCILGQHFRSGGELLLGVLRGKPLLQHHLNLFFKSPGVCKGFAKAIYSRQNHRARANGCVGAVQLESQRELHISFQGNALACAHELNVQNPDAEQVCF